MGPKTKRKCLCGGDMRAYQEQGAVLPCRFCGRETDVFEEFRLQIRKDIRDAVGHLKSLETELEEFDEKIIKVIGGE